MKKLTTFLMLIMCLTTVAAQNTFIQPIVGARVTTNNVPMYENSNAPATTNYIGIAYDKYLKNAKVIKTDLSLGLSYGLGSQVFKPSSCELQGSIRYGDLIQTVPITVGIQAMYTFYNPQAQSIGSLSAIIAADVGAAEVSIFSGWDTKNTYVGGVGVSIYL